MLYLTTPPPPARRDAYRAARLGAMFTPETGNRPAAVLDVAYWAADNGCFAAGDRFDLARYYAFLDARAGAAGSCLFATAPDVLCDAAQTWERSAPTFEAIRARGYYVALVAQNGIEEHAPSWDEADRWDWLFIGGDDAWKDSAEAADVAHEAHLLGKCVHVGRVNTRRRFRLAAAPWDANGHAPGFEAESADGTCVAIAPDVNLAKLADWLPQLDRANGYAEPLTLGLI